MLEIFNYMVPYRIDGKELYSKEDIIKAMESARRDMKIVGDHVAELNKDFMKIQQYPEATC